MIAMFLQPGVVDADKQIYPGQGEIQALLLLLAFISVPFMLFGPPLAARAQFKKVRGCCVVMWSCGHVACFMPWLMLHVFDGSCVTCLASCHVSYD